MSEFDAYLHLKKRENPIKYIVGGSHLNYLKHKALWFLSDLKKFPLQGQPPQKQLRLLDFGCGKGEFLKALQDLDFLGTLEGCDISKDSITEGLQSWETKSVPHLYAIEEDNADSFLDNSYDIIITCCVFHHIPTSKQLETIHQLQTALKPQGRLIIFEHNPLNPVTQWIVRTSPIDKNAVLLKASRLKKMMESGNLRVKRNENILFFPPLYSGFQKLESLLSWFPFACQYMMVGEKPSA